MPRPIRESVNPYVGGAPPHTYQHTVGADQALIVTARFVDADDPFVATATYAGVPGVVDPGPEAA